MKYSLPLILKSKLVVTNCFLPSIPEFSHYVHITCESNRRDRRKRQLQTHYCIQIIVHSRQIFNLTEKG